MTGKLRKSCIGVCVILAFILAWHPRAASAQTLEIWPATEESLQVCPGGVVTLEVGWRTDSGQAPSFRWTLVPDGGAEMEMAVNAASLQAQAPDVPGESSVYRCTASTDGASLTQAFELTAVEGMHQISDWHDAQAATALKEGTRVRTCLRCNAVLESEQTPVLGPLIRMNVKKNSTVPMQSGQVTTIIKVTQLQTGDYIRSWKSSRPKTVKVTGRGKLTAGEPGKAKITVRSAAGASYAFYIRVQAGNVGVKKITTGIGKRITLARGKRVRIGAQVIPVTSREELTYTSSNSRVASVKNDVITARRRGTAVITVKAGRRQVKIRVRVTQQG